LKKIIITLALILTLIGTSCSHEDEKEYEVNVHLESEEAGEVIGEGTYEEGKEVELAAKSNQGHDFSSWSINGETVSEDKIYRFKIQENVDIKAEFESFYDPKRIEVELEEKGSVRFKINTRNELDLKPKLEENYEFIKFNEKSGYYREMEMVYKLIDFEGKEKSEYINLNINDEGLIKVGPFYEREEITIKAEPVKGSEFSSWQGEQIIKKMDEEIQIIVDKEDNEIKANYKLQENPEEQVDQTEDILENLDKLIEDKKWKEFGEYLENLAERDIDKYKDSETKRSLRFLSQNKFIEVFKNEDLLTVDKLEKLNWEEIQLEKPSLEILEREPENIYLWFYEYESLMNNLRYLKIDLLDEFNTEVVTLDAVSFIEDIALQYKDDFDTAYWKRNIGDSIIYVNNSSGPVRRTIDKELEVEDVIVDDNTIIFKLDDRVIDKTIYIDYVKKDDGTFRVVTISDNEKR